MHHRIHIDHGSTKGSDPNKKRKERIYEKDEETEISCFHISVTAGRFDGTWHGTRKRRAGI